MTDDDPRKRIVADDGSSSARETADGVTNMICFQPLWYCVYYSIPTGWKGWGILCQRM